MDAAHYLLFGGGICLIYDQGILAGLWMVAGTAAGRHGLDFLCCHQRKEEKISREYMTGAQGLLYNVLCVGASAPVYSGRSAADGFQEEGCSCIKDADGMYGGGRLC